MEKAKATKRNRTPEAPNPFPWQSLQIMSVASVDEIKCDEPGAVDLWCYSPESNPDPDLLAAQAALLSSDERERCERFRLERDRRLFVATRALVRTVLCSYFPVAPGEGDRAAR